MVRSLAYASAALLVASVANPATAQSAKNLVGAWAPVSAVSTDAAGKNTDTFGPRPQGMLIFTADGRYTLVIRNDDLPKVAANARPKVTGEEGMAIVQRSIAHYGRYTVDEKDKSVTFQIQGSTYANWDGQAQKRPFTVKGDQLNYKVPTPSTGGSGAELVWKRLKPEL